MRGSNSVRVSVLMLSVGLTGAVLYVTSQQAIEASAPPGLQNWTHLEAASNAISPENLSAIAAKSNGAFVVGTRGAKVNIKIDDTYAVDATGTTKDLFSAHCWDSWCVVSGIDIVAMNKYDGGGWFDLVDTDGSGSYYTPVLLTTDRVFFGWPGTTAFAFDYLCYQMLDVDFGMCRMVSSPVMDLNETSTGVGGPLKNGDVVEWPWDLTAEIVIHDQLNDQQLDLVHGGSSPFFSSGVQGLNRRAAGSYEYCWHPGTPGGTWDVHPIPYTMDAYGFATEPGASPPQDIVVVGGDTGTNAMIVSSSDGGDIWQQEATDLPPAADYPLAAAAVIPDVYGGPPMFIMVVGDSGTVLTRPMNSPVFHDGFESGGLSVWSVVVPPPTYTPTHTNTPLPPWPTPTPTPTK